MESLLDGQAEALTQRAIERALNGDMIALRLCLDRIAPARRERTMQFDLPPLQTAADTIRAHGAIAVGVADGQLTPSEATALTAVVGGVAKSIELVEIEQRLKAVEALLDGKNKP